MDKQALASRVVDAKTPESQYNKEEMEKLMVFEDDQDTKAVIEEFEAILSAGSSDEVLRQLLRPLNDRNMIASILDQGSLLKDNEEAHLSVEEKRQADAEYEAEANANKPRVVSIPSATSSAPSATPTTFPPEISGISSLQFPPGHYLAGHNQSAQPPQPSQNSYFASSSQFPPVPYASVPYLQSPSFGIAGQYPFVHGSLSRLPSRQGLPQAHSSLSAAQFNQYPSQLGSDNMPYSYTPPMSIPNTPPASYFPTGQMSIPAQSRPHTSASTNVPQGILPQSDDLN